ncbi:LacI family transcriptional regulator [bacterium]|nr:LacI family transcriptional regulator [bacterium]
MSKAPTRKQVALEAGVSEATVSRVYNRPNSVIAEKVERVKTAAQDLGYCPNKYASALRRNGSGVILFLERHYTDRYQWTQLRHYNAFYAEIIRTLTKEAEKTLYHLRLQTVTSEKEILEIATPAICDGIIGFNFETEDSINILVESELPYVCCHHTEGFKNANRVSTDNYSGGAIQANQLKKSGYDRPVYITGALAETFSHQQRLAGFLSVYGKTSLQVIQVHPSIEGGQQAGEQLVQAIRQSKIDSIGVVNDLTAIGIIHALMRSGLEIPNDVGIIGYDNLPVINALPFQLTTIDLQLNRVYEKAFWSLLDVIQDQRQITSKIKPILCAGESVKHNRV